MGVIRFNFLSKELGMQTSDFIHFSNLVRYADENKVAVVMPSDYNA